jgi:hypothetical protein
MPMGVITYIPNVLWTFEVVWELINQLFEPQEAQT